MIAIDPGAVHCGVATWCSNSPTSGTCDGAFTVDPDYLYSALERTKHTDLWVIEEFRLYPWVKQDFDTMATPEVIGVIKYIARKRGISYVLQPAMIKKVTRGHLRSHKIELLEGTVHAQDAQLHGYYYLLREKIDG